MVILDQKLIFDIANHAAISVLLLILVVSVVGMEDVLCLFKEAFLLVSFLLGHCLFVKLDMHQICEIYAKITVYVLIDRVILGLLQTSVRFVIALSFLVRPIGFRWLKEAFWLFSLFVDFLIHTGSVFDLLILLVSTSWLGLSEVAKDWRSYIFIHHTLAVRHHFSQR